MTVDIHPMREIDAPGLLDLIAADGNERLYEIMGQSVLHGNMFGRRYGLTIASDEGKVVGMLEGAFDSDFSERKRTA